jgi:hypothetical protein
MPDNETLIMLPGAGACNYKSHPTNGKPGDRQKIRDRDLRQMSRVLKRNQEGRQVQ